MVESDVTGVMNGKKSNLGYNLPGLSLQCTANWEEESAK